MNNLIAARLASRIVRDPAQRAVITALVDTHDAALAELRELLDALMENRRKDAEWLGRTASKVHRLEMETIPAHDAALAELRKEMNTLQHEFVKSLKISMTYTDSLEQRISDAEECIENLTPPAVPDAGEHDEKWWAVADAARDTWIKDQVDDRDGWLPVGAAAVAKAAELGFTLTPPPLVVMGDDHPAVVSILQERKRQTAKWGEQRLSWPEWMSILSEEVGEAARMANQAHWLKVADQSFKAPKVQAFREELVHSAAVAVQIIEHLDEWLGVHVPAGNDQDDTHGEPQ